MLEIYGKVYTSYKNYLHTLYYSNFWRTEFWMLVPDSWQTMNPDLQNISPLRQCMAWKKPESVQQSFVSQKYQTVKYITEKDTIKQTSWMMALFFSSSLDNNRCQKKQNNWEDIVTKTYRTTVHRFFFFIEYKGWTIVKNLRNCNGAVNGAGLLYILTFCHK